MRNLSIFLQQGNVLNDASNSVASTATDITSYLGLTGPVLGILGGVLLLIIGYFIAKFFGGLVKKLLQKTGVDSKTGGAMKLSTFAGKLIYYLFMIIVLMATLTMMGVSDNVLAPLNDMGKKFFGAIPNMVYAGVIAYIGYFLAKIVADLIEASGDQIRSWMPKLSNIKDKNVLDNNLSEVNRDFDNVAASTVGGVDIVRILKNLAFIFVFVPILIIALDQLNMRAITDPATNMLDTFINAIPNIIYAVIILLAAVVGGKILVGFLKELLSSLNVNNLANQLKISNVLGNTNLVNIIANLAFFFIVYVGIVEASKQLGLTSIVEILDQVLAVAGKVVFGLIILALGNVVANFATKLFLSGEGANKFMATIIKGAVMVIFLAMGLHAMGIANDIIELAFGLGLGAIAVAFALSFGLGGREAAGDEVKHFFNKFRENK